MNELEHKVLGHFERSWGRALKNRAQDGEVSFEDAVSAMQENPVLADWIEYTFLMISSTYRWLTNYSDQHTPTTVFHSPSEKDAKDILKFFDIYKEKLEGLELGSLVKYGFPSGESPEDAFRGYPQEGVFVKFFEKYEDKTVRAPGEVWCNEKGTDFQVMRGVAFQKILDASRKRRNEVKQNPSS